MTQKNLELSDALALDFTELCARIADAYSHDATSVDGSIFAYLAKRLIAAEIQSGGPYNDESDNPTIRLNAAIGRLFFLMGRSLPNVDAYLDTASPQPSTADHEALELYKAARKDVLHKENKHSKQHTSYRRAIKTLTALEDPVKTQALHFLERIEAADTTREIAAISHFTKRAIKNTLVSPTQLNVLGEANVHSWIAYTIYDHILDKEADAALLPAANVCMRLALAHYQKALPARHPLQPLIVKYFDKVDTISAWEVTSCRFPVADNSIRIQSLPNYQDYEALAWRSCIHILGPLIVAALSPSSSAKNSKHLVAGLHHYLIARQLGDDIHDWREDLMAGRITAVVALLLARQELQENSLHSLDDLIPIVQKDFLNAGAIQISQLILQHTKHALFELAAAGCDPSSELIDLVRRLERMANESIRHQQRFADFQNEYSSISKVPLISSRSQ